MIVNKILISSLAALTLISCGDRKERRDAAPPAEAPALGAFGIDLSAIDETVDPGDDFYAYVNGGWLKTFKIPDEYASYGSFSVLAERSEQRLKEIVESAEIQNAGAGASGQKARDYYAGFLDVAAIDAKGLAPLAGDFARIDAAATPAEIAALAVDPSLVAKSPIGVYIAVGAKRPGQYAVYLTQSGLGLPNRDYYLEERWADKQSKYKAYIAQTLARAGIAEATAEDIYALELQFARAHWDPAKRRNRDLTYNLKTVEQLEAFAPEAPWRAMLATEVLSAVGEVILREDDAVRNIAMIVAATPVETLRVYLKFHLVNANAEVLPHDYDEAKFAFFGAELRGAPKQKERWKRAVAAIDGALGEAVGRIYVEEYFPAASKAQMIELVGNLRAALGGRLDSLGWVSEETRGMAREKLAKL